MAGATCQAIEARTRALYARPSWLLRAVNSTLSAARTASMRALQRPDPPGLRAGLRQFASWVQHHQLNLFQACRADTVFFARDLEAQGRGKARSDVLAPSTVVPGHCRGAAARRATRWNSAGPAACRAPDHHRRVWAAHRVCQLRPLICCSAWAAGRDIKADSGRRALGGRRRCLPGRGRRQRLRATGGTARPAAAAGHRRRPRWPGRRP